MRSDERGFTLVELMVVVVVIAVLLATAIPSMLTARGRAMDRQAQRLLRTGYETEKVHFLGQATAPTYTADTTVLAALESSVDFATGAPAATDRVYVAVSGPTVYLATKSRSGRCWYVRQDPSLGTVDFYGDTACGAPTDALPWRARW